MVRIWKSAILLQIAWYEKAIDAVSLIEKGTVRDERLNDKRVCEVKKLFR